MQHSNWKELHVPMLEAGYVCLEIAPQIPPRHPHEPSCCNTKRRDSKEQPLISKDSPTQFPCVITASSGDVVSSCVFGVLDLHGEIQ